MLPQLLLLFMATDWLAADHVLSDETNQNLPSDTTLSPWNQEESAESMPFYQEKEQPVALPEKSQAAQPVISISERVQVKSREKKDLGTLGYVLGILMVVIIIAIGSGIVFGYMYKRAKDLKRQHDQEVAEREEQRINLPLSAFLNPSCDTRDETTIEISSSNTGPDVAPLISHTGTPGA
uniref:Phosphoinositide-3-kinase-interacting protein 1 n=1 Tax=Leptobrachium leishanense TaxID=445787 RepID=A0A8C5M447_9ANUR